MKVVVLVVLAVLFAACDKGAKKHPAPPTPTGVLKGRVTATVNGPGVAHGPDENITQTTGTQCALLVIDRSGNTFDAKTTTDGQYELTVPAGHYEISFADCARGCGVPAPQPVEVAANTAATANWDCERDAK